MGTIKLASAFFIGNLLFGSISLFFALILRDTQNPILISIFVSILIIIASVVILKKRRLLNLKMSSKEILFVALLFLFGFYIMQKSLSYSNGNFEIASNQYFDFGNHIPIIRSFSIGDHIPPAFPYFAGVPNTYHFMFDYLISLYEKLGFRIDYAFNILSAGAFAFVSILIYHIAHELFGKNKTVGILSVVFFFFNSSLSFMEAIKKYGLNFNFLSNIYHNSTYLGNGPSGESIVSVFWNFNTYLNQRPFLFGLGIGLLLIYLLLRIREFSKGTFLLFAITIGVMPLWHMTIFISLIAVISTYALINKPNRKNYLSIIAISMLVALPQLIYIAMFSNNQVVFRPGFLLSNNLNLGDLTNYWFFNLGVSLFTVVLGVILSSKKQKLFFLSILPLFILPNLFQFGALMFDNHKFLNIFIIFANVYSAYLIYLLLKKGIVIKAFGFLLIFLLTFSGIIDFFVIKNDVKTTIADWPSSKFQVFVLGNTPKNSVFLSNKTIYDPITFVGRQSFLGEPHYLFTYGKNPDERIKKKDLLFSTANIIEIKKILHGESIAYIVLYKDEIIPKNQALYMKNFKSVYQDREVSLLMSTTRTSPD